MKWGDFSTSPLAYCEAVDYSRCESLLASFSIQLSIHNMRVWCHALNLSSTRSGYFISISLRYNLTISSKGLTVTGLFRLQIFHLLRQTWTRVNWFYATWRMECAFHVVELTRMTKTRKGNSAECLYFICIVSIHTRTNLKTIFHES